MTLVLENLGGQVLGSSAESKGSIFDGLGKSEICEFEVAVGANEDVLGFEVAVDDVFGVQVLEDEDDVGGVEAE